MKKILNGFTLAEVLITIVVIGIIAMLTLPNVVSRYSNESMLSTFKKAFHDLEHNVTLIASDGYYHHDLSKTSLGKAGSAEDFVKKHYLINSECGATAQPCFAKSYRAISKSDASDFSCTDGYSAIIKGGYALCVIPKVPADIYVDVNGPQDPNLGGRDMFHIQVAKDFTIGETAASSECTNSYFGAGCLNRIIDDRWRMEY